MSNKMRTSLRKRLKKHNVKIIDSTVTIESVYDKYNGVCQSCSVKTIRTHPPTDDMASIEHKKPISLGGNHTWDNVELFCHKCNTSRNNINVNENNKILKSIQNVKSVLTISIFCYKISISKAV